MKDYVGILIFGRDMIDSGSGSRICIHNLQLLLPRVAINSSLQCFPQLQLVVNTDTEP